MATTAKTTVASIAKAIDNRQVMQHGIVIATAIHDLIKAEGAIDSINQALAKAKESRLPWGDARNKNATGLVHAIRAEYESKGWQKGNQLDKWIATIAWCYKEGVRVQVNKLEQQKAPERIQLDLITGKVLDETKVTDVGTGKDTTRKPKAKTERNAAHWLIKARTETGYIPIMGHFAQMIRLLTAEERKGFDTKAIERLLNEALIKAEYAKMDGNEIKAI